VNVVTRGDSLSTFALGPDGDIFNVRGFQWKCPAVSGAVLPSVSSLVAAAFPTTGLQLNSLLECLKYFPSAVCVPKTALAPVPLSINLIEGVDRPVVTDPSATQVKPTFMNFFVQSLCPGFLALPATYLGTTSFSFSLFGVSVASSFSNVRVSVMLVGPTVGSFLDGSAAMMFNGTVEQVNAALSQIVFIPNANGTQTLKVTLITPSGNLEGFSTISIGIAVAPASQAAASPAVSGSPSPSGAGVLPSQAVVGEIIQIVGTAPGRVGSTQQFTVAGDVATFSQENAKAYLSAATGVSTANIEIVSISAGSVVVKWRFVGLSGNEEELAKAQMRTHCLDVLAKSGVDCSSLKDNVDNDGGGSVLQSGPIIGIVLGIVGAIGLIAAVALLASAFSKSRAAPASKSMYGEEFYTVANPGFDAPPPTPTYMVTDAKFIP
jgi:hypothetical protein